jgi:hypothetical protein
MQDAKEPDLPPQFPWLRVWFRLPRTEDYKCSGNAAGKVQGARVLAEERHWSRISLPDVPGCCYDLRKPRRRIALLAPATERRVFRVRLVTAAARNMPSGRKAKDLTAQRFGLLYVTGRSVRRKRHAVWLCWCDCGRIKHTQSDNLLLGRSISCGCVKRLHPHWPKAPATNPA